MTTVALQAQKRTQTGKGVARRTRAAGFIPGVLYGPGEAPVALQVSQPEFMRIYHGGHGENVLVDLRVDTAKPKKVLFREVQRDPVTERVLHIDFYHVSLTKPIRVHVPVHLEGIPSGVKLGGGVLQHVLREVEVECLPTDIPEHLTVDVSALEVHDAIHVSDLPATKWKLMTEGTQTVASVVPPVVIKEEVPAEAAVLEGAAEATEPERIGEKPGEEEEPEPEKGERQDKREKREKKER
jgi:large subunit ribosomal protein L25